MTIRDGVNIILPLFSAIFLAWFLLSLLTASTATSASPPASPSRHSYAQLRQPDILPPPATDVDTNNAVPFVRQRNARVVPGQLFGLDLRIGVGLEPNKCSDHPVVNVPAETAVTYCYFVTNVGSESLHYHTIVDDQAGILLQQYQYDLPPGAQGLKYETITVTESVRNVAIWSSDNQSQTATVSATAAAKVYVDGLSIAPSVSPDVDDCSGTDREAVQPDSELFFCYRLTNETDLTLTRHTVTYTQRTKNGEFHYLLLKNEPILLKPGEDFTTADVSPPINVVVSQTTEGQLTWVAEVSDLPPDLGVSGSSDPVSLRGSRSGHILVPGLSANFTVGLVPDTCATDKEVTVFVGRQTFFCYSVTNVGGVTLTHHNLIENIGGTKETRLNNQEIFISPGQRIDVLRPFTVEVSSINWFTWTGFIDDPATASNLPLSTTVSSEAITIETVERAELEIIVFEDVNRNGRQDTGEPGIPFAIVTLLGDETPPTGASSDSDGTVLYSELLPQVVEILVEFADPLTVYEPISNGELPKVLVRSGERATVSLGYVRTGDPLLELYLPINPN